MDVPPPNGGTEMSLQDRMFTSESESEDDVDIDDVLEIEPRPQLERAAKMNRPNVIIM